MIDNCGGCILKGDLKACKAEPCSNRESWYAIEQKEEVEQLKKDLNKLSCGVIKASDELDIESYDSPHNWLVACVGLSKTRLRG